MLDFGDLIERAEAVLAELARDGQSPLISLASLKRKGPSSQHYGGSSGNKTGAARPSNVSKNDGDRTGAGVSHKDVKPELSKTFKRDTGAKHKGPVPQAKQPKAATKASPGRAPSKGGEKPTSCPGGGQPRMVFGKWKCSAKTSKGATQGKSRIAKKRQAKKKAAPPPKGTLGKLVAKARTALLGLFK